MKKTKTARTWVLVTRRKRKVIHADAPPVVVGPRSEWNVLGPFSSDAAAELCASGDYSKTHRSVTEYECLAAERSGEVVASIEELVTPRSSFYLTDESGLVWVRRDGIFIGYRRGDDGTYRAEGAAATRPRNTVRHPRRGAL